MSRFKLGDSFGYDVMDGFRDAISERYTNKVTAADDRRVEINNREFVFDQMGSLLKNRFGDKSPAILQVPADIEIGKKWRLAFTNTIWIDPSIMLIVRTDSSASNHTKWQCTHAHIHMHTALVMAFQRFRLQGLLATGACAWVLHGSCMGWA